jgi:hypothetical protein
MCEDCIFYDKEIAQILKAQELHKCTYRDILTTATNTCRCESREIPTTKREDD